MTKPPEKTAAEGALTFTELFCETSGETDNVDQIERGIQGADLMPMKAQLSGAGCTGGDLALDLKALVRLTPGISKAMEKAAYRYLRVDSPLHVAALLGEAQLHDPDVRDRVHWHLAHRGRRESAEALLATAILSGGPLQRAYAHGLLLRVARWESKARWEDGIDEEILRCGLTLTTMRGEAEIDQTRELLDYLSTPSHRTIVDRERSRIGEKYPRKVPLSAREAAEWYHDRLTVSGHWEPRTGDEYADLSSDWREEAVFHPRPASVSEMMVKARRADRSVMAGDVAALIGDEDKPDPLAPDQAGGDTSTDPDPVADALDPRPRLYVLGRPEDKDGLRLVEPIAGRTLPLSLVPADFDETFRHFMRRYPYAPRVVERVLGRLRAGAAACLEPILLVGEPGCGKTTFLTEVASFLHLHATVYPCASVSDGSFGGTPAQWQSRRVSVPLQAIVRSGKANPVVILDEIEKSGISERNGALVHALLPMLERHTASSYFETGIELNVDLSAVSFVATANSLSGVPDPLLDRFTVLRMPSPGVEHTEALAHAVIEQLRDAHEERPEERPAFAPDELAVIRRTWGGGSMRKLHRIVDATLEARETYARSRLQ